MSAARRLIVNADGFGFGPGATQGIFDAIQEGQFISSVSVNANFPEVERVGELIKAFPQISIGVHLNPMAGRPCLSPHQVPSLVNGEGFFYEQEFFSRLRRGAVAREELEAEFDAQIGRVKMLAGERLTHLDSQGNSHLDYFDLFLTLAKKWGVQRMRTNASLICLESPHPRRARLQVYSRKPQVWLAHRYRRYQMGKARKAGMRMADRLLTVGYTREGNKARAENWVRILRHLPPGTHEIYCHPAYPDAVLRRWSYYCDERRQELEILRQGLLREVTRQAGVEVISFDQV
ncbi:MAG: ChbG/HpnK family deacetylase [Nitrospinota bacterium]|nr:MAG: ChbG/HpnK family deacetylase [Nitrospinota bacterium]